MNCAAYGAGFLREPPAEIGVTTGALHDFGVTLAERELKALLTEAFAETLAAVLAGDSMTEGEKAAAASLALNRHSCATWVLGGIDGDTYEDHTQA